MHRLTDFCRFGYLTIYFSEWKIIALARHITPDFGVVVGLLCRTVGVLWCCGVMYNTDNQFVVHDGDMSLR